MAEIRDLVRARLAEQDTRFAVDVHRLAEGLGASFPHISHDRLAALVAEEAVKASVPILWESTTSP